MAMADNLNVKEFHIQVLRCYQAVIKFVKQWKDEAENFNLRIVIKLRLAKAGLRLVPKIKRIGLSISMTASYHSKQYTVADAMEAEYIALYFGRWRKLD